MVYLIITSCSKTKDDSVQLPPGSKVLTPYDYIDDFNLTKVFITVRETILKQPETQLGLKETYAFDLYVRRGKAYSKIYYRYYQQVKDALLNSNNFYWFFLSGGYGIINGLERAKKYNATFNKTIANESGIPYTAPLWMPILPRICDAIFRKLNPENIYVFGSRDYTQFIKRTQLWRKEEKIKIFESYGRSGVNWIAEKLCELTESLQNGSIEKFNIKYPGRLISQEKQSDEVGYSL